MELKGTVLSVAPNGTFEGKHGTLYKHYIKIDVAGKVYEGEYASKKEQQTYFIVGQEVDFVFTDGQWPKIKPVQQGTGFTGGQRKDDPKRQASIIRQSSLKVATEICLKMYDAGILKAENLTEAIKTKCIELEKFVNEVS